MSENKHKKTDPTKNKKKDDILPKNENKVFEDIFDHIDVDKSTTENSANKKNSKQIVVDDLTKIEGIGPKIKELLYEKEIRSFGMLAKTSPEKIRIILKDAGGHFSFHDPSTRAEQARLANKGNRAELDALQEYLEKGRKRKGATKEEQQKKKNDTTIKKSSQKPIIQSSLDIKDISSYIQKTKETQKKQDTIPLSQSGKDLREIPNIYAIVPHSKGDHKLVYLREDAPNVLLNDEKRRIKGSSYIKKGMKIYDVYVDFKEHPLLKNKNGELLAAWIIDSPEDLTLQLHSIQEGRGGGTNFRSPLILKTYVPPKKNNVTETVKTKKQKKITIENNSEIHKTTKDAPVESIKKPRDIEPETVNTKEPDAIKIETPEEVTIENNSEIHEITKDAPVESVKKPRDIEPETVNTKEPDAIKIEIPEEVTIENNSEIHEITKDAPVESIKKPRDIDTATIEESIPEKVTLETPLPTPSEFISNKTTPEENTPPSILNIDTLGHQENSIDLDSLTGANNNKTINTSEKIETPTTPSSTTPNIITNDGTLDLDNIISEPSTEKDNTINIAETEKTIEITKTETPTETEKHPIYGTEQNNEDHNDHFEDKEDDEETNEDEETARAMKKKIILIVKGLGVIILLALFFILWRVMFSTGSKTEEASPLPIEKDGIVQKDDDKKSTEKEINKEVERETEKEETKQKKKPKETKKANTPGDAASKLGLPSKKKPSKKTQNTKKPIVEIPDAPEPTKKTYTISELKEKLEAQKKEAQKILKGAKLTKNKIAIKFTTTVLIKAGRTLSAIEANSSLTADEVQKVATKIDLYLKKAIKSSK